jgi:hypothetical protein
MLPESVIPDPTAIVRKTGMEVLAGIIKRNFFFMSI